LETTIYNTRWNGRKHLPAILRKCFLILPYQALLDKASTYASRSKALSLIKGTRSNGLRNARISRLFCSRPLYELLKEDSLCLLNICYREGLVDPHTFLSWLAQQADPNVTNIAQFILVVRLAEEYVDGLASSWGYSRPFLRDCLKRLDEVSCLHSGFAHGNDNQLTTNSQAIHIQSCMEALKFLILRFMMTNPESLVAAEIWREHSSLIENTISECAALMPISHPKRQDIEDGLYDVKSRNDALLLHRPSRQDDFVFRSFSNERQVIRGANAKCLLTHSRF
jgi:hypothetical protein